MQTLADIGEDELIRRITAGLTFDSSVVAGPGDDCAVVRGISRSEHELLKTDAIVEGVHFTAETPAALIGRKALARVISDFAAMGGTPRHAMVTLIAPPGTAVARVLGIYKGLRQLAQTFAVNLVGGETSRGDQLVLSVSLTGSVPKRYWSSRSAGRAGDALFVTGRLGGSIGGKHLKFQPRLAEGQWLVRNFPIHAMMDLSDGLAKDLPRLARASGLTFDVAPATLPSSAGCTTAQAWGDGEDYELLFAVPPRVSARLEEEWARTFPKLKLTRIGTLVHGLPSSAQSHASGPAASEGGWDHFR